MDTLNKWLLPEGVDEALPGEAACIEHLRRRILDLFDSWGYELVMTPMIEYLESLLVDGKQDLQIQTFQLTDQLTGRRLGVRADMTPQVARMDAHVLHANGVNRLCYFGTVLKTRPEGVGGSRAPLQFGAEVYGHEGLAGDVEVIRLMLAALTEVGVSDVRLELGHLGIYSALAHAAGLTPEQNVFLFDLLRTKARHEIRAYLEAQGVAQRPRDWFTGLSDLYGDAGVLAEAGKRFGGISPEVDAALDEFDAIARMLSRDDVELYCDLGEFPGYHYETGVVFAAFTPGAGREIARGGRYDDIGRVFGRARPAVGFSSDLKLLAALTNACPARRPGIFAPGDDNPALRREIAALRTRGERVVVRLDRSDRVENHNCDRILVEAGGAWVVEKRR